MHRLTTSILLGASLVLSSPAAAQGLVEIAQDTTLDGPERIAALTELRRQDADIYVETLAGFLNSSDVELAEYSAESLVNLVVMMGSHDMSEHKHDEDAPRHDMAYVQDVLEVLRANVTNTQPRVRSVIAPFLIGAGNEEALASIAEATSSGEIGEEEALNYFYSAPSDLGSPYLRSYAEGENEELAEQVIAVLASDTGEQTYLRDQILTNAEFTENRRATALGGLARYDANFSNYVVQPEVLELALSLSRVPGTDLNGSSFVQNIVLQEIRQSPELGDFYSRRLDEIGPVFSDTENAVAFRNLTRSLEQKF
ncbi:MAG: hypothetical protein OXC62_08095 [Aestuariivita sp.]|nr:hypothetical protein [Aestuariivita sp.]